MVDGGDTGSVSEMTRSVPAASRGDSPAAGWKKPRRSRALIRISTGSAGAPAAAEADCREAQAEQRHRCRLRHCAGLVGEPSDGPGIPAAADREIARVEFAEVERGRRFQAGR